GSAADFPGVLGPVVGAGAGQTAVLRGAAVVMVDANGEPRTQNAVLDLSGPAANLSHYATTHNLVVIPRPASGLDRLGQFRALREAALRTGIYLAQAVVETAPATRETYALAPLAGGTLPRVAYVYQLHSHQYPTQPGEPVLYGDNVRHLLPTILHPNEVLDGAVVRNYRAIGMETYAIQNHPVIGELYRRHGHSLDFAGVVVTVAHNTLDERERAVTMATNLVAHTLRADGAVLSKSGGGAPHVDMAQVAHQLEGLGVRTTLLAWELSSSGSGDEGAALFNYPDLDAIVNFGSNGFNFDLPAVERTVVGRPELASAMSGALKLEVLSICGAMGQLGDGRLTAVAY
ncbi:MAG TPA: glycine/sarcosine/betaine reductase component B subunit, partial [Chloroflexia bacterium]|nr:glycine/sarcosine/betaine reductase component B subunit [Chloroflexia bacterium]